MNKLLVLTKNQNTYFIKRLIEEVGRGDLIFINPWEAQELDISEIHGVIVRTFGVYRSDKDLLYLEDLKHLPILNPISSLEVTRSKITQSEALSRLGIPVLPWSYLNDALPKWFDPKKLYIRKPQYGQGGWGVTKCLGTEVRNGLTDDFDYIVQPYITAIRELRVFFILDWVVTFEREGELAANFSLGGRARLTENSIELTEFVRSFQKSYGIIYGAMDVLEDDHGYHVLEMNAVPGIEQVENVTGLNIMAKLLEVIA